MSNNPRKYSDFIQPDASITDLISQLEKLRDTYTDMLSKVQSEAAKLETAMEKVSGATESGRNATKKAATDAERLEAQYKKLKTSQSDIGKEIASVRLQQQKQNQINKLQIKLADSLEGSYDKLSAQYSLNKIALNKMSEAERKSTKIGKGLEKQTRDIYEEMNRLQKATGKHSLQVGNYAIATENLHPILGRVNSQLGSMGTNLQDLSNADKPFKVLISGVKNFGKAALTFMLSPIGLVFTALAGLYFLIANNKDTVIEFNSDLIDVGKTADISGEELRDFGQDIVDLSRKLKTVGTPALLQYAKVAGQLGVKGTKDILAFTESLAKLEQATNIAGDQGAADIARLLTLTDGGVENISDFGDEIVNLGNNFAATESEILSNSTAIAQNTGQYRVGRRFVLAYGTATKAVGLEAEITGSTIGRTLGVMERAIRTGENIQAIANTTGNSVEELKAKFRDNAGGVFTEFIAGLNRIDQAGGSVNEQLENISIKSIRDQRVLASLATNGFDVLEGSISATAEAAGALDKEFENSSSKLEAQLGRVKIAWDNLILSIEDGEGALSKIAAFFAGLFANALDDAAFSIKLLGAGISGLVSLFRQVITEGAEFLNSIRALSSIEIDFKNPLQSLKNIKNALGGVTGTFKDNGKNLGNAFLEGFAKEMARVPEVVEESTPNIPGVSGGSGGSGGAGGSSPAADPRVINQDTVNALLLSGIQKFTAKKIKANLEGLDKEILDLARAEKKKQDIIEASNQVKLDLQRQQNENIKQLVGASVDAVLQTRTIAIDKEIEKSSAYYDEILSNENLSDEKRSALEDKRQRDLEKLEKQRAKKEKENFLISQGFALGEIAIEAAKGIATATAQAPATFGASLSWIPLIIGSAAAQAGIIIAQTIPQLWTGGEVTESGKVMINDDPFNLKGSNYREVVEYPSGKVKFPQGRNKIMDLPKGSKVYPDYESFANKNNLFDLQSVLAANGISMSGSDMTVEEIRELRRDFQNMGSKFDRIASRPITVNNTVVIDDKRPYY